MGLDSGDIFLLDHEDHFYSLDIIVTVQQGVGGDAASRRCCFTPVHVYPSNT
jgi:hypothetical protein